MPQKLRQVCCQRKCDVPMCDAITHQVASEGNRIALKSSIQIAYDAPQQGPILSAH